MARSRRMKEVRRLMRMMTSKVQVQGRCSWKDMRFSWNKERLGINIFC